MSGICGIVALSAVDPTLSEIEALTRPLQRRGPDGTHSHLGPKFALGHNLLATTSEALVEVLPLADGASGCTITADARLDNRDELIAALELGGEARTIGDGELILRAYLKWDQDCPTRLLGDFAFAIWDSRHERLFCARDHMGMRQFNYCHVEGKFFAFATEDTALLELEWVPKTLNEARVADFIGDLEGYDFRSTFFESILRLPPAHSLTIDAKNGCSAKRYWQLRPGPQLNLGSDKAYGDALLKVFREAVRCRMRNAGSLGMMLSGGLDSSAVVAVAAGIGAEFGARPLKTFSAVGPDPAVCPETKAIHAALTVEGLDPTFIGPADLFDKSAILKAELNEARNPFEQNATMLRCIYLTARNEGVNIVLDGGAGDVVLTSDNRIASLLAKRQFRNALREVEGEVLFWKPDQPARYRRHVILSAAWVAYAPLSLRSLRRRILPSAAVADLRRDVSRRLGGRGRLQMADRHVAMNVKSDASRRAQAILHPNLTSGRERFDQLAGSFGVESRDPFMDIRLIEFCLSLPPEQLQDRGWPKIILRRAVEGLVPRDIAWRRGKEHLGWDFTSLLMETAGDWQSKMRASDSPLRHYLSPGALRSLFKSSKGVLTSFGLRLYVLDRFLRKHRLPRDIL
jgi:asparagine synthase (glutamine-hydrolysing)